MNVTEAKIMFAGGFQAMLVFFFLADLESERMRNENRLTLLGFVRRDDIIIPQLLGRIVCLGALEMYMCGVNWLFAAPFNHR